MATLNKQQRPDFVAAVLGEEADQPSTKAINIQHMLHKWGDVRPGKTHLDFFDRLVRKLNLPERVTGSQFIEAPLDTFIKWLPTDAQDDARAIALGLQARSIGRPLPKDTEDTSFQTQQKNIGQRMPQHAGWYDTPAEGVRAGRLDTRHYYLDSDAARNWDQLIQSATYVTYDECRVGLAALVATAEWKRALEALKPSTVVMLAGGGSATKDYVVLKSLLAQPDYADQTVEMWIIDVSPYMIANSMATHRAATSGLPFLKRVRFKYFWCDVLHLQQCDELLVREPRLFAITAGTIGNLSERQFFESLNGVSSPGDLLIVSADTIDDSDARAREATRAALRAKYDHPDLAAFIAPGIAAVISELRLNETIDLAAQRLDVRIEEKAHEKRLSDVANTWAVTVLLRANGQDVILVNSTRYRPDTLIAFAGTLGWSLVCRTPSPLNPHFVQFCFRKTEEQVGTA